MHMVITHASPPASRAIAINAPAPRSRQPVSLYVKRKQYIQGADVARQGETRGFLYGAVLWTNPPDQVTVWICAMQPTTRLELPASA
jgi:hypothetical protein